MSIILNIETATPVCSVCISREGKELITREIVEGQAHAEQLTLLIEEAFEALEMPISALDAVAVSAGPGSYTGLRIGFAVAKGICYALDKPLITVDSLKAIAYGAYQKMRREDVLYCPMIDARRMEVYTALYDYRFEEPVMKTSAKVITSESFLEFRTKGKQLVLCGNGAAKCRSVLNDEHIVYFEQHATASNLPYLSQAMTNMSIYGDLLYAQPSYYKSPNITVSKKKI